MNYIDSLDNGKQLTNEEQIAIVLEYQKTGDLNLVEKILSANIKFLIQLANKHKNSRVDREDLIAVGCLSIKKAMDSYIYTEDVKFLTFVSTICKRAMKLEVDKYIYDLKLGQLLRRKASLFKHMSSTMTDGEIMAKLNVGKGSLAILKSIKPNVSLDTVFEGSGGDYSNLFGRDDKNITSICKGHTDALKAIYSVLTGFEQLVIIKMFGFEGNDKHSFADLERNCNISYFTARHTEKKALAKLREYFEN